jgi:hypothetical protein
MLPTREELLAKAAALPDPPISFGAGWDGDTQGWFVIFYAMLSGERCRHLGILSGGSDYRIFAGAVPPWPEAQLALSVGAELAERYGVPFEFLGSPTSPELDGGVPDHTMTAEDEARAAEANKRFQERVERLREHSRTHRPSEVLALLMTLVPRLESADITWYFLIAFKPHVRLRACIDAQYPARVFGRGISDEQFDAIFEPYWSKVQSADWA